MRTEPWRPRSRKEQEREINSVKCSRDVCQGGEFNKFGSDEDLGEGGFNGLMGQKDCRGSKERKSQQWTRQYVSGI